MECFKRGAVSMVGVLGILSNAEHIKCEKERLMGCMITDFEY